MMTRFHPIPLVIALCLVALPSVLQAQQVPALNFARLSFQLATDKTEYFPGELVRLDFHLTARAPEGAAAPDCLMVENGYVRVFLRFERGEYLEYHGPGWGMADLLPHIVLLPPGEAVNGSATLLYNHRPETAHLRPLYAEQALSGRIPDEYALSRAGFYQLKARLYDNEMENYVDSDPVQIRVIEPEGENAPVWETMRRHPELGFLVQAGVLPGASSEAEEQQAESTLNGLLSAYPGSAYARQIRPQLEKFRNFVQMERRKAAKQQQ